MNCERLQPDLCDYLDGTLSPEEKAAAQEHLLGCSACRQALQREQLLTQTLAAQLQQAVEAVALDAQGQRIMARAVQRRIAKSEEPRLFSFWNRIALPFAAAALVLLGTIWLVNQVASQRTSLVKAPPTMAAGRAIVPVHLLYSVPNYIFHKEGNVIVDALTYDTRSMDGALLAKK